MTTTITRLGGGRREEEPWSDDEKKIVREKYRRMAVSKLAALLNSLFGKRRTIHSVGACARRLGLQEPRSARYAEETENR